MAGIKDVAREAGVSASTVSYVLSGKRSISAKTTGKVMAAVEKLGYTPDASARKMRGMRNQIIALSAPIRGDINQARYNAYFLRTAWAARNAGYDVMLLTGPDAVKDIRRVTQSNLADGIVLLDVEQDDERAAQSGTFSKPCVAIGYPSSHAGCACVDIDFALMGRKAVDFLYEKGHRTVVFLRNNESDYNRHSGYVVIFRESLLAHAKELGIELHYVNTSKPEYGVDYLRSLTGGTGYNDVICFAPVKSVVEQADDILGFDGCLNFFAGPTDKQFSAKMNFYDVHYNSTHVMGTTGGNTADMIESLELTASGRIDPAVMVTHIGGLDAAAETTLNLPKIPGGKKLIYTHLTMPLIALTELRAKGAEDARFTALADIVDAHNGLWCPEAEEYLLANFQQHD